MLRRNINSMNFKELRKAAYEMNEEIEALKSRLDRYMREIEDTLENLDDSNMSAQAVKEKNSIKSQLDVLPDRIRAAVMKGIDLNKAVQISVNPNEAADGVLDVSKVYKYGEQYFYYNKLSKKWELVTDNTIYSVFEQTENGFYMRGNVIIDGNTVQLRNITFDASSTPLKVRYTPNQKEWYNEYNQNRDIFMQISVDGGASWGEAVKITAIDGTDANVTAENVFSAMTDDGAQQGLFSTFYTDGTRLYINAEYIQAQTVLKTGEDAVIGKGIYLGTDETAQNSSEAFANGIFWGLPAKHSVSKEDGTSYDAPTRGDIKAGIQYYNGPLFESGNVSVISPAFLLSGVDNIYISTDGTLGENTVKKVLTDCDNIQGYCVFA